MKCQCNFTFSGSASVKLHEFSYGNMLLPLTRVDITTPSNNGVHNYHTDDDDNGSAHWSNIQLLVLSPGNLYYYRVRTWFSNH